MADPYDDPYGDPYDDAPDDWFDDPDGTGTARPVGLVPVEGRGSLPFALLHGESLVAAASWALGEAGVRLLDFTDDWAAVQALGAPLVVHDPLCAATPVAFLRHAVAAAEGSQVVAGVRPVTDTVRTVDAGGVLGGTVDRDDLRAVTSPVVLPAPVVAGLPALPGTDDLADLVAALRQHHDVLLLEAPAAGRRVADDSDLRLVEALSEPDRPGR